MPIKFLISSDDTGHDFVYELFNALDYQQWCSRENLDYKTVLVSKFDKPEIYKKQLEDTEISGGEYKIVPIGNINYVKNCTEKLLDKEFKNPIDVSNILREHFKRDIISKKISNESDFKKQCEKIKGDKVFVKNISQYKYFSGVLRKNNPIPKQIKNNIGSDYLFSDYVSNIRSEFRVFVFKGELVALKHYAGNSTVFPDIRAIKEMISVYNNTLDKPPAYTLDVIVTDKDTKLLEIHPLVSCGLYGFRDYGKLPQMLAQAYRWIIE